MRTEQITIYKFDDLDDDAKERAREGYRQGALDYEWWGFIFDDACEIGKILGIDVANIYFSGFWSQGDGACFEGSYAYKPGAARAIKSYAPKDETLHAIARDLQSAQRPAFYELEAHVAHRGHYYHSGCTDIQVVRDGHSASDGEHDSIADPLRAFMDWIYSSLEREHDWLMADEQVDESIRANEYEFHADGSRAAY